MPKRRINVCLDETVYQKLVEIAKRDGLNRSAMVAVLVNEKYEKIKKQAKKNRQWCGDFAQLFVVYILTWFQRKLKLDILRLFCILKVFRMIG